MAASASAAEFHSEAATTGIDGSQKTKNKFITEAGTVECSGVNFTGTQSGATATSVTVTPSYSGCTAFGFATAHVEVTGCTMKIFSSGTSELLCGATGHIVITPTFFGSVCTTTIGGNQHFATGLTFTNEGAGTSRDTVVDQNITGIKYTSSGGSCGTAGSHSDGTLSGSVTTTGTAGGKQVGIWWQ
jgi:hypothetical protein